MSFEIDETMVKSLIKTLADLMVDTDLTEIEVEEGGKRVRVSRNNTHPQTFMAAPYGYAPQGYAPPPSFDAGGNTSAAPVTAAAVSLANHAGAVTSPMVGTAYRRPDPSSPEFIAAGSPVKQGDTLMIIEAMKVMNPIKAPKAGIVKQVLVEDGQPVEFGEVLVIIE